MICFLFILYQCIVIPYNISFSIKPEGVKLVIDTIIDVFFIADLRNTNIALLYIVFINFNCGFYRKGVLVMTRKDIILNYLKTWFLLDLLASFPYSWIINIDDPDSYFPPDNNTDPIPVDGGDDDMYFETSGNSSSSNSSY